MGTLPNTSRFLRYKNIIPFIDINVKKPIKGIKVFIKVGRIETKLLISIHQDNEVFKKYCIEYFREEFIFINCNGLNGNIKIYFEVLEGDVLFLTDNRKICYELEYENNKNILISIVTPTYNSDVTFFKETYKSVLSQSYENWEWCIVDDGSSSKSIKDFLKNIKDNRIQIKFLKKHKGISYATTEAIKMSKGDFIGFLDHDDLLSPDCLQEVIEVIDQDVKLIYSDEDKIIWNGEYIDPFYKPDFNYILLLNNMYIGHFLVIKKDLIQKVGYLRQGYEGSQDYDLVLRVIENIKAENIKHIPKILYHWRVTENSTSYSILKKPLARIKGLKAVEEHLARQRKLFKVYGGNFPCHYCVKFDLEKKPYVNIIILFKDKVQLLKNLLDTSIITNYPNYKIILVDNNSKKKETKEYLNYVKKQLRIKNLVEYKEDFNFSKINNYIVNKYVDSELVLFLNNDIEIIHPEWLYNMVQYFTFDDVSVVGAKLLYLDHRIQHAGIFVGVDGVAKHIAKGIYDWDLSYFCRPHLPQEVSAITGACMLVKVEDFGKVKGFDENLPLAFNDIDFCLKIKKILNKKIIYTPEARLYHLESATRGYDDIKDKEFLKYIEYMKKKWDLDNFKDPFYNSNLVGIL